MLASEGARSLKAMAYAAALTGGAAEIRPPRFCHFWLRNSRGEIGGNVCFIALHLL